MALTSPPEAPVAPGAAPSRLVESTFDELADAAWSWLFNLFWPFVLAWLIWYEDTFKPELAALQADVQANATIAQGAVLTIGAPRWVSGSVYAIDDPVYSPINYQTYIRRTVGAGVTDPSLDPVNWAKKILAIEGYGSTTTTSAVDITLDNQSTRLQVVAMTAEGKWVKMPDATTLADEGGPPRIIHNNGAFQFALRDYAGTLIGLLDPGMTAAVHCTDSGGAAGTWLVANMSSNGAPLSNLLQGTAAVLNAAASTYMQVVMVTPTKAVIAYQAGGAGMAVVVDLSGASVAPGTPQTITASGQGIAVCRLTASRVMFAYRNPATFFLGGVIADIAGTVLSPGTVNANLNGGVTIAGNELSLAPISASQALAVYVASGSTFMNAAVITVTGITIAAGAVKVVTATAATFITTPVPLVAGTKFVVTYYNGGNVAAIVIEVAGAVVTNGSPTVIGAASQSTSAVAAHSSTKVLTVCHNTSTGYTAMLLDIPIGSTTIGLNPVRSVKAVLAAPANNPALVALGNGKYAFSVKESNSGTLPQATMMTSMLLTVRGTDVLPGPEISNAVASLHPALAVMSADKLLLAHAGTSNFVNAQVLEVAP